MSTFGSPGGKTVLSKPVAPERGSFPLDHDGECKIHMTQYLRCLKAQRGVNANECRGLSKAYLKCRMDKNLMAHDEMKNLGFSDIDHGAAAAAASSSSASTAHQHQNQQQQSPTTAETSNSTSQS